VLDFHPRLESGTKTQHDHIRSSETKQQT
jgi:hypothetical protein